MAKTFKMFKQWETSWMIEKEAEWRQALMQRCKTLDTMTDDEKRDLCRQYNCKIVGFDENKK